MMDVTQRTANGALHHEATNTARLVAANDGVLHCIRDGIDHDFHERYVRSRHVALPCRDSDEECRRGTPVRRHSPSSRCPGSRRVPLQLCGAFFLSAKRLVVSLCQKLGESSCPGSECGPVSLSVASSVRDNVLCMKVKERMDEWLLLY